MDLIHVWEENPRLSVILCSNFFHKLRGLMLQEMGTWRTAYEQYPRKDEISFSTFKNKMKPSFSYSIHISILLFACRVTNTSLYELEQSIVSYKISRGNNQVVVPVLPIRVTPLFDMLLAHHIGDGNVVRAKNGRLPYFSYRQYNQNYLQAYKDKVQSVFGRMVRPIESVETTREYCFLSISQWFFSYYELSATSFLSETARSPDKLLQKGCEHQLAFLLGIIIDEGHVDSTLVVIRMKNRGIIKDLGVICKSLNYKHTITSGTNGMFNLYILRSSLDKLYLDYCKLLKKYPEVNLYHKADQILQILDRRGKTSNFRVDRKQQILKRLEVKQSSCNELARFFDLTRQGVRHHLKYLVEEDLITVKYKIPGKPPEYVYGLS